jgi:prepilin-type processing-associated H-X9-DG protein
VSPQKRLEFKRLPVGSRIISALRILDGQTGGDKLKFKRKWKRFARRHQKGGDILFLDWHVKWFSREHIKADKDRQTPRIVWDPDGFASEN